MIALGFCLDQRKWLPGALSEGTQNECERVTAEVLRKRGMSAAQASDFVAKAWCDVTREYSFSDFKVFGDMTSLLRSLRRRGIKTAVCTMDSRTGTEQFLDSLGIRSEFDVIMCGDDPDSTPKPAADNALTICNRLQVDPSRVVIVGDTSADMGMGRNAQLGLTVAVLSGVGEVHDLKDDADYVINDVSEVLRILTPAG